MSAIEFQEAQDLEEARGPIRIPLSIQLDITTESAHRLLVYADVGSEEIGAVSLRELVSCYFRHVDDEEYRTGLEITARAMSDLAREIRRRCKNASSDVPAFKQIR